MEIVYIQKLDIYGDMVEIINYIYITISMGVCPTIKQEIIPSGKLTVRELEHLHAINGKINELNCHFP